MLNNISEQKPSLCKVMHNYTYTTQYLRDVYTSNRDVLYAINFTCKIAIFWGVGKFEKRYILYCIFFPETEQPMEHYND